MGVKRRLFPATPGRTVRAKRQMSKARAKSTLRRFGRRVIKRRRTRKKVGGYGRTKFVNYDSLLQHKLRTRLHYCDTKTIQPVATQDQHTWRLNSLFDPDQTGGGHRPGYTDEWSSLYDNYRVTSCRWYITCAPKRTPNYIQASTTQVTDSSAHDQSHNPGILAWQVSSRLHDNEEIEAVDKNILRETRMHGGKDGTVGYKMTGVSPYRVYKFSGFTNMRTMLDSPEEYNQNTAFSANPTHGVYLTVAALSKDGNTMSDYRIDIRLVYTVEISNRKASAAVDES